MKKKYFLLAIAIMAFSLPASAQEGRYVRKQRQPNFYIPKVVMEEKTEKLPEFHIPQPEKKVVKVIRIKRPIEDIDDEDDFENDYDNTNDNYAGTEYSDEKILDPMQVAGDNKYLYLLEGIDLNDYPAYQTKFEEYLEDLEYIANTGEYPENQGLAADLGEMDSNLRIKVGKNFGI